MELHHFVSFLIFERVVIFCVFSKIVLFNVKQLFPGDSECQNCRGWSFRCWRRIPRGPRLLVGFKGQKNKFVSSQYISLQVYKILYETNIIYHE